VQNPLSELSARPWHYPKDGKTLSDIDELKQISEQWRLQDKKKIREEKSRQYAAEYDAKEAGLRLEFLNHGTWSAREGTDTRLIEELITKAKKEQRLLKFGDTIKDGTDKEYNDQLTLLITSLEDRLQELAQLKDEKNVAAVNIFNNELKSYAETRRVVQKNKAGKKELRLLPITNTEIVATKTEEERRTDTEFEAYFISEAVPTAIENERNRQQLIIEVIDEATRIAIERGLLDEEEAQELREAGWSSDEFEAWFEGKNIDANQKFAIKENLMRQLYDDVIRTLLARNKRKDDDYEGTILEAKVEELRATKHNVIALRKMKTSAEVVDAALFSEQNFADFVWEYFSRPDIAQELLMTFMQSRLDRWSILKPAVKEKYGHNPGAYLEEKVAELNTILEAKTDHKFATFLLDLLGVDIDLLSQALGARATNSNSASFATNEQAARALFGEEGPDWSQDIDALEAQHNILTPLTQRATLLNEDYILPEENSVSEQEKHRMNFAYALHLKIGLDTPSKFVDYDKVHEVVEAKAMIGCMEVLNVLLLLRSKMPETPGQAQLDHFNNERRFIQFNMPKLAENYLRLTQSVGEEEGREYLLQTFMNTGKPEDAVQRISAFVALIDTELPKWIAENGNPHTKIFTPDQNEEERMS
jgi:hypothetical protein